MFSKLKCFGLLFILWSTLAFSQEKGKIAGKVIDAASGEELIGVAIGIKGTSAGTVTDLDGRYFLMLAPGTHTILVSYVGYITQELTDITITANETKTFEIALKEDVNELEEVVVTAKVESASTNALLIEQKNSVSVSSGISAELIRRTPDRNTADVMKRVSGASIQDGKFAIIRGLNERYNTALLNGAILPSTESDRKAFSFDLIPSGLIDKLTISKSFTPDMPGDVAGGLIQITTRDIPDSNKQTIQLGIGANSITTNQGFYRGVNGKYDQFGFDDKSRSVPEGVGNTEENVKLDHQDPAVMAQSSEQATNQWTHHFTPVYIPKARPNMTFQYSLARRAKLAGNDLGVIFALTYNNNNRYDPQVNNVVQLNNEANGSYYKAKFYRNQVLGGAILNLSYKIGENTKLSVKNLFNINSESYTMFREGVIQPDQEGITVRRKETAFYFHSNKMMSTQLGAEHFLPKSKIKINYVLGLINIDRQMPDYRRISYEGQLQHFTHKDLKLRKTIDDGVRFTPYTTSFTDGGSNFNSGIGASRFFSSLNEKSISGNYDVKIPFHAFFRTEIKVGGFHQFRNRDFMYRTFVYKKNGAGSASFTSSPDSIFTPDNFSLAPGSDQNTQGIRLDEDDLNSTYKATANLNAFYAMADSKYSFFRVIYGVRIEQFRQQVFTRDKTSGLSTAVQDNVDILPSVSPIISVSDKMAIKMSYSKTLNRPEFRELAPVQFFDFYSQSLMQGNTDLKRATIKNYDVRWEYYPTASEAISVNPFYKDFFDPIENITTPSEGIRTFSKLNQKSAKAYGVELELRKSLREIDKVFNTNFFKRIVLYGNYTYIKSKLNLDLGKDSNLDTILIQKGRPLQGQSPYIINAGILYNDDVHNWSFALSANRVGDRIAYVSQTYNLIIWEAARTVVDFKISKTFFNRLETSLTIGDLLSGGLKIGKLINMPSQPLVFYNDDDNNGKFNSDKDIVQIGYNPSLGVSNLGYNTTFSIAYNFK